ncbi:TetR family transcriptional regulator [Massilia niabensis]|uniref:TetR family transcriptional regulator n=1 Tax=Massilia niabensis TaxID=544910 RepID=A0ABW0LED7_9BURK
MFVKQGVSRTTLQHVASAAGVTRGAIYWHFDDKSALFNAMLERATLPFECARGRLSESDGLDPISCLFLVILEVFRIIEHNPRTRRVFAVVTVKVEFVDELGAVRARLRKAQEDWLAQVETLLKLAVECGQIRNGIQPGILALNLWSTMDGLMRTWMFNPTSFSLMDTGTMIIMDVLNRLRIE